jgi:hypothetical protein
MKVVQWFARRLGLRPRAKGRARFHDAMPPASSRVSAIEVDDWYRQFFSRYQSGRLPRWANLEFEQFLSQTVKNFLQKLELDILAGRNGRPSQQERCLAQIPELIKKGYTDEQGARELGVQLRTYQRYKRASRTVHIHLHKGFGVKGDANPS